MSQNALVIYRSSAGSGKTYTLVMEYLKLVLNKPSLYSRILAITFTNKATEEMKSRIIDALVDLASYDPEKNENDEFIKTVSLQTGLSPQQTAARAIKVLDHILHDYSSFSVSTIDSFFSKLVRSLSRELHLPVKVDLELDTDYVATEITDLMFSDLNKNNSIRRWLTDYVFDKMDQEKGWSLRNDIHYIAKFLFRDEYRELFPDESHPPDNNFISKLRSTINDFESSMANAAGRFESILERENLEVSDFLYGKGGVAGYLLKLKNKIPYDKYQPGSRASDAFEKPEKWVGKSSPHRDRIIALAESDLMAIGTEITSTLESKYKKYLSAKSVYATAYMAGILGTLDEKLTQYRDENEVLLISDNNILLSKAIGNQDAPFIYEKSGNRYSHFMLDEFQDTSTFQWSNLRPLIENSLGEGNFTLIVGDAKQSIYRWRGGNMSLLQEGISRHLKIWEPITQHLKLDANYRSREIIVNFNNRFFEIAPHTLMLPPDTSADSASYQPSALKQDWKKGMPGEGFVRFRFFENHDENVDTETGEITDEIKWKDLADEETFNTIQQLWSEGFQPRDIAILTRKNIDAKNITSYLISKGINRIISPESMQLNQSDKVLFLISALTFINDTTDDVALSYMVYHRLFLSGTRQTMHPDEVLSASRYDKLGFLQGNFSSRIPSFSRMPLYDLCEELTRIFDLCKSPDAYIQRFLDLIIEYSGKYQGNISEFLEWWNENQEKESCSVIIPSGENAIRVMTIHKSKGLQFPVVIIPYGEWELEPHSGNVIWVKSDEPPFNERKAHPVKVSSVLSQSLFSESYDREITLSKIDNLNLFYVACTRAEEHLYVFTAKSDSAKAGRDKMSDFIHKTLYADENWAQQIAENNEQLFELGICNPPLHKLRKEDTESPELKKWISVPWDGRIGIAVNRKKVLSSDPEIADTAYGLMFHDLASGVTVKSDAGTIIEDYFKSKAKPEETIIKKLSQDLSVFIQIADERNWFRPDAETLTETEILMQDGSILRPDRVIISDEEVIVVDYKTGAAENSHEDQIRRYADILKEMGYLKIKMYLVYPSANHVNEISVN